MTSQHYNKLIVLHFCQQSGIEDLLTSAITEDVAAVRKQISRLIREMFKNNRPHENFQTKIVVGQNTFRISGPIWQLAVCSVQMAIASHAAPDIDDELVLGVAISALKKLTYEISTQRASLKVEDCVGKSKLRWQGRPVPCNTIPGKS